jgi:3-(3-hydroxy-phenyl)propionate hydroxylase
VQVTGRTARFLRPADGIERTFRSAVIGLARRYPFARQLVNTGRMAVANAYTQSRVCESTGGLSVQNVAFAWLDGSSGCVNDLLRWADDRLLLLVFGDLAAAAAQRLAAWPFTRRCAACRCWPRRTAQAREAVRDPQGHLQGACHVFGHAWALVRPDGYLAATGEAVDGALVAAIERASGPAREPPMKTTPTCRTPTASTNSCSTPTPG